MSPLQNSTHLCRKNSSLLLVSRRQFSRSPLSRASSCHCRIPTALPYLPALRGPPLPSSPHGHTREDQQHCPNLQCRCLSLLAWPFWQTEDLSFLGTMWLTWAPVPVPSCLTEMATPPGPATASTFQSIDHMPQALSCPYSLSYCSPKNVFHLLISCRAWRLMYTAGLPGFPVD